MHKMDSTFETSNPGQEWLRMIGEMREKIVAIMWRPAGRKCVEGSTVVPREGKPRRNAYGLKTREYIDSYNMRVSFSFVLYLLNIQSPLTAYKLTVLQDTKFQCPNADIRKYMTRSFSYS